MAGSITIYTSGWPKNQNKCSNNTGDPPWLCNTSPAIKMSDKKKEVPKLLSIISISAADKSTGKDTIPIIAVTKKAHIVRGRRVIRIPFVLKFITVTT